MAGIGPGPENLLGAALGEQADLAQTASDLTFRHHLSAAAHARIQAAANSQSQLNALTATENAYEPVGDILQNLDALSLKASNDLLTTSDRQTLQAAANNDVATLAEIAPPGLTPSALGITNPDLSTVASSQATETAVSNAQATFDLTQAQTGYQAAAAQSSINSDESIAANLNAVDGADAQKNDVSDIQKFKLGTIVENADLATLARIDNEAGITLGMLDTSA